MLRTITLYCLHLLIKQDQQFYIFSSVILEIELLHIETAFITRDICLYHRQTRCELSGGSSNK